MQAAGLPVKYAGRSYIVELCITMALYMGVLFARPWVIDHLSNPALITAAKVAPAIPIWLTFYVILRYYRRIDEFEKLKFLKTMSVAFGISSCLIVSYSFLEDAGLPPLAITWGWPTLAVSWALTSAIMSINNHR
jgi:hypothetical protein